VPSETDLLNDALGQIGAARVTAIDDGSINANHCQTFYPPLRDGALRAAKWNFTLKRVELAQDATGPEFEFAYSYTLPTDCLRVWEYYGANPSTTTIPTALVQSVAPWKIEGRKLVTNDAEVKILYGARLTNPDVWDALFYQYLTTHLASKLASAIPKDERKANSLLDQAIRVLLPMALASDGQEGSVEPFVTDELLWGRTLA